jgi:hypothetical protein
MLLVFESGSFSEYMTIAKTLYFPKRFESMHSPIHAKSRKKLFSSQAFSGILFEMNQNFKEQSGKKHV